jgi:hypothetical protein
MTNRCLRTVPVVAGSLVLALLLITPSGTSSTGSEAGETVTWSKHIAPLFQQQCQGCHRPGDIGPFSLVDYGDAYRERQKILRAVELRKMPPWKPVPGFGEFLDVRRLGDQQIALVREWVAAGAPEGDPRDLPPPREWPNTWTNGTPDLTLAPETAYEVPSSDRDLYRCFVIPTNFPEDRYVSAVEFVPGNRKIVHHVLTYVDTEGASKALDEAEPGLGYTCFGGPGFAPRGGLGGWAPGMRPQVSPDGVALLLPAGARVVMQVHYHNRGAGVEMDRTQMGLHFARTRVDKRVRSIPVLNRGFTIPAGAERHQVTASYTLPPSWNVHAIGVSPHMHLLGREMKVWAKLADESTRPLIHIDDWDFHWQGFYFYKTPVALPVGSFIEMMAAWDNSADNPRNPNTPPRRVYWGERTVDEMGHAAVLFTFDDETPTR